MKNRHKGHTFHQKPRWRVAFLAVTLAGGLVLPGCGCSSKKGGEGKGTTVSLRVSDKAARSCEFLMHEDGGAVQRVEFSSNTTGTFVREQPLVSAAFHANSDEAIGEFKLHLSGGDTAPSHEKVSCFDAKGEPLSGVTIIQGS